MTSLAICEIGRHSWSLLREASGSANHIPDALRQLVSAKSAADADEAYWRLENHVVVQGQLFSSAEQVVQVLLATLVEDAPRHVRSVAPERGKVCGSCIENGDWARERQRAKCLKQSSQTDREWCFSVRSSASIKSFSPANDSAKARRRRRRRAST